MPESLIREHLNELEKNIVYYNKENVADNKKYYANKIIELLFPFKTVVSKLKEEELERIRKIIEKTEEIIKQTYTKRNFEDGLDYQTSNLDELNELKLLTREKPEKYYEKDEELQQRRKELREELKSKVRKNDGINIFQVINSISNIRLYKDIYDEKGEFVRISPKNMILSSEDMEKLQYLREVLTKEMKEYAEELYFEKDPAFKMIIEEKVRTRNK